MDAKEFNRLLKILPTDKNAIDDIYNYYFKKIVLHYGKMYGNAFSEDIAQEFFIKLLNDKKSREVLYPTIWIYSCCNNIIKRRMAYESRFSEFDEQSEYEVCLSDPEIFGDVKDAILRLSPDVRQIVYLNNWEGYSLKEIAIVLEEDYAVIRQKYHRALKLLKKILNDVTK